MTKPKPQVLYRICERDTGDRIKLVLARYQIHKHTSCGYWIIAPSHKEGGKWLPIGTKYAKPTKQEAVESFARRKTAQIRILQRQLTVAEAAKDAIEEVDFSRSPEDLASKIIVPPTFFLHA